MKAVEAKDLIVGRVYSDTDNVDIATFFRYEGKDNAHRFTYLSGDEVYGTKRITFPLNTGGYLYELSEEELKQYLPK